MGPRNERGNPTALYYNSNNSAMFLARENKKSQCECRPNNFGRKLLEMCKSALAIFEKYCHHWNLKVNLQKTKVIIFCKRKEKKINLFLSYVERIYKLKTLIHI